MEEKENINPIESETFIDNPAEAVNPNKDKKFGWGLYVLIGGGLWAVFELIDSILYFF